MNILIDKQTIKEGDEWKDDEGNWQKVSRPMVGMVAEYFTDREIRRPSEQDSQVAASSSKPPQEDGGQRAVDQPASPPKGFPRVPIFKPVVSPSYLLPPSKQVIFPKNGDDPTWQGRNGMFHGKSLNIHTLPTGMIRFAPVGKRGEGNCWIDIPPTCIRQLAAILNDLSTKFFNEE